MLNSTINVNGIYICLILRSLLINGKKMHIENHNDDGDDGDDDHIKQVRGSRKVTPPKKR